MDRFTNHVIAAEGKRHIADAAADHRVWQRCLDLASRLDEVEAVTVVFLDTRRNCENVGIENNVARIETDLFGQDSV